MIWGIAKMVKQVTQIQLERLVRSCGIFCVWISFGKLYLTEVGTPLVCQELASIEQIYTVYRSLGWLGGSPSSSSSSNCFYFFIVVIIFFSARVGA